METTETTVTCVRCKTRASGDPPACRWCLMLFGESTVESVCNVMTETSCIIRECVIPIED